MQRLILMRHAEAERAAGSGRDRDRVLSSRGRIDAAAMGRALAARGMRPDLAVVSPAARTLQTWDLLHDAFGDVQVRADEPLYNGGSDILRRFVEAAEDEAGCLMVVAHNPGVHLLAMEYMGNPRGDRPNSSPVSAYSRSNFATLQPRSARSLGWVSI